MLTLFPFNGLPISACPASRENTLKQTINCVMLYCFFLQLNIAYYIYLHVQNMFTHMCVCIARIGSWARARCPPQGLELLIKAFTPSACALFHACNTDVVHMWISTFTVPCFMTTPLHTIAFILLPIKTLDISQKPLQGFQHSHR